MPIKLQKYNIESGVDNPDNGYMILGFNPQGQLVWKDEKGAYGTVVPTISTQSVDSLEVKYLTIGIRLPGSDKGLYSVGQGDNIIANGLYSYAQGYYADATNTGSTAHGSYVSSSGDYSYVGGKGQNNSYKLYSAGITSFVHSFANSESGTLADYSVILGGYNHKIELGCDNSVILGGYQNIISANNTSVAVISCHNLTTALDEVVYVPRIVLIDGGGYGGQHSAGVVEYESGRFKGYTGPSTFSYLDSIDTMSSLSNEVSDRISADSSLTAAVSTSLYNDSSLTSALSTEIGNRSAGDSGLSTALSTETSSRIGADSTISSALSTEIGDRSTGDSNLSSALSTETGSRISYDSSLSTAVSGIIFGDINLPVKWITRSSNINIPIWTWVTVCTVTIDTVGIWFVQGQILMYYNDDGVASKTARITVGGTNVVAAQTVDEHRDFDASFKQPTTMTLSAIVPVYSAPQTVNLQGFAYGIAQICCGYTPITHTSGPTSQYYTTNLMATRLRSLTWY